MSKRRAISTIAVIALTAVTWVMGLGLAARSAKALGETRAVRVAPEAKILTQTLGLGVLGLTPGALALTGAAGVVVFWPNRRRRAADVPGGPASGVSDTPVLAPAA